MTYNSKTSQTIRAPLPLARMCRLTAINAHGEAYAVGAEALGLDALRDKLEAVNQEHARAGYLTPALKARRQALYDELLTEARRLLTPEGFTAFYSSL